MGRPQIKKKCVDGNKADWPSGLRRQTQESHQSRILAHECVLGFESHSCQKTFWTRWGRAFSRQILSHWNVNSRWQSQAENKKIATSSVADSWVVKKCIKRRYPADTRETRKYAWVWTQIFSNGWHKPLDYFSEFKNFSNGKATNQKKMCRPKQGRMAERSKAPGSRKSSVENSGTRMCAWVRIQLLSLNVFNTMRQSLQLTNSVILESQFKMIVQSKRKQKNRNVVCGW